MFLPADVDQALADRFQAAEMLTRTGKPIVLVTYELAGLLDALEMAEIVAGGREAHAERPQLGVYINVTRGLRCNEDAVRKLLLCAERGIPALWIPVTSGGTTGPITLAGTLAVNTAGVLAGVVLAQLAREGAPVVVPGFGGDSLDLRTMVDPYCGPEPKGVAASLAHRWSLPMFSLGGCSDSKAVDGQAAAEAALTMLADALAGGHLIHDSGYLEAGLTGSLAQLVICDEIAGWIRALLRPIDTSDDALALDLVDQLGVDGSFLDTDHTLARFRERWYPTLFDRRGHEPWRAAGATTLAERAGARVDEILASQAPAPLEPDVERAVRAVVERANATAGL
jgi:trimethylamine--corrinoid protein Co-methyltransferase